MIKSCKYLSLRLLHICLLYRSYKRHCCMLHSRGLRWPIVLISSSSPSSRPPSRKLNSFARNVNTLRFQGKRSHVYNRRRTTKLFSYFWLIKQIILFIYICTLSVFLKCLLMLIRFRLLSKRLKTMLLFYNSISETYLLISVSTLKK